MAAGSNRITFGWVLAISFWLMSVLMFTVPTEDTSIGRDSDGDGVDDGCDGRERKAQRGRVLGQCTQNTSLEFRRAR